MATMQTAAKVQHENLLLNEMSHWRVSFQERESVSTVKLDSSKDLQLFPLCAKYESNVICYLLDQCGIIRVFFKAVEAIMKCYRRAFPQSTLLKVPEPEAVQWGHSSLLRVNTIAIT